MGSGATHQCFGLIICCVILCGATAVSGRPTSTVAQSFEPDPRHEHGLADIVNHAVGQKRLGVSARLGNAGYASNRTCDPRSVPLADRCQFVREVDACTSDDGLVHYITFHYCTMHANPSLSIAVQVLLVLVLFYVLTATADKFFCPALERLALMMRLPSDVAGATLLSFGNGAPDVFTQLAALGSNKNLHGANLKNHVQLAMGAVMGAGMFICSVVLPVVVLTSRQALVSVEKVPFIRDATTYLVAVAAMFWVLVDGRVHFYEAIALCAVYASYMLLLVVTTRLQARQTPPPSAIPFGGEESLEDSVPGMRGLFAAEEQPGANRQAPSEAQRGLLDDEPTEAVAVHSTEEKVLGAVARCWAAAGAATAAATAPADLLLGATMPIVTADGAVEGPPWLVALCPVCAPLFFVLSEGLAPQPLTPGALGYGVVGGAVGAVVLHQMARQVQGGGAWPLVVVNLLSLVAFVVSVVWMDVAAGELVALFQALGEIIGVSPEMLGATVLAWGNSLGDLVADSAMSRSGQPSAAIAACFAGPLFNLLCGTSVTFVYLTSWAEHGVVHIGSIGYTLWCLFGFHIAGLLHAVLLVPTYHRWNLSHLTAWGLLAFYAAYMILYILFDRGVLP